MVGAFIISSHNEERSESRWPHLDLVGQAVMRGCMDRLLLFGMDVDIKDAITSQRYGCKTMDRHLIQLVPLHKDIPLVRTV